MKHLLTLILLILCSTINSQVISSLAGNGTAGFSGDGSLATLAMINRPNDVVVASNGDIFFSDASNNRVRKITAATNIITTVAGNGTAAFSGDGGQATSASISRPSGIALDASGNIYIADSYNNRIRKVTFSTGIISTVVGNGTATFAGDGGQAIAASIGGPSGVLIDASNNIYICDRGNSRIRKVLSSNNVISTFAGTGATSPSGDGGQASLASFGELAGLVKDASGNIFITERYRIRKIAIATGIITTVAGGGSGTPANDGDGALATLAIMAPNDVAIDAQGNLFISDGGNNRIRKVLASDGKIYPFAGGGSNVGLNDGSLATTVQIEPGDLAFDNSNNIIFGDHLYMRIRKITNPVVPVLLGYFKVTETKEGSVVKWQTLSELNTTYFSLESSLNGVSFNKVINIQAGGNSSISKEYTHTDKSVYFSPKIYYRLKIVDKDGSFTYSSIVIVNLTGKTKITISPNPGSDFITVGGFDMQSISLFDNDGRLVELNNANGASSISLPINKLAKGLYQVKVVSTNGDVKTEKFIKQ